MDRQSSARERAQGSGQVLSRRKIFKGAVGVAAVGAGAGVLTDTASPALAAPQATTVEPGAVAPAVVNLTDGASIAVDASLGNDFRVTIAGNRTMTNPANPSDGQKITFQVTQGANGPFTLTWGSAYEFSTGLPKPTLSTTAGDTDLLCFIYNATKSSWLLAAYVNGFATPTSTSPSGVFRLFPSTNGPASPVSYTGPFVCGVVVGVTSGGCWLNGYWWWVCPTGQSTSAQKFALWSVYNANQGSLVPNSTVTGALTAGQWNYVALPTPIPLAFGATYVAATGFSNSFPDTNNQFGSGDPYSAGIVNGPLTAYSDASGKLPSPFKTAQGVFSVASTDPAAVVPIYGSSSCNFWMDLEVDTSAPSSGATYRLWPSYPTLPGHLDSDTAGYTLATEFQLSKSCTLDNIWFYSASGAGALPTQCAIWNVSSQSVVAGTDSTSPSWSGAAGSGWVSCAYSGVTLPAGDYKVAVFYAGGSQWYQATTDYWGGEGTGAGGITTGPVTAPGTSAATSPGQSTYNKGSWAYPQSYDSAGGGENYWVDVEVTPS